MQMISFNDMEELNQFLVETKEDSNVYVKSVKTVCVKNIPIFFVLIDDNKFSAPRGYGPRRY